MLEEASNDPDGENAESGPGARNSSSGFGGLGLAGMVGMEELVGAGNVPPGDGKSGEMSGESSW